MGWTQRLPAQNAAEADIDKVLDVIDAKAYFGGKWIKKSSNGHTFWHTECDIYMAPGEIVFSGSWCMSGDTKLPQQFASKAKEIGLQVGSLGERE